MCNCVTDAPTNVIATALTSRSVEVTWNPSHQAANVISYVITYTTTASYAFNGSMMISGRNTTRGTLTNLQENTPYTITVQAMSGTGTISGSSNEVLVTTYTDGK